MSDLTKAQREEIKLERVKVYELWFIPSAHFSPRFQKSTRDLVTALGWIKENDAYRGPGKFTVVVEVRSREEFLGDRQ